MKSILRLSVAVVLLLMLGCKQDDAPGESGVFMRFFGTAGNDLGTCIVETTDGGFAFAGSQHNAGAGEDAVLLRTDADGKLLWRRTFGADTTDRIEDMLLLSDGGYLLVGATSSGAHGGLDAWLLRTDAQGELLWAKDYGGEANEVLLAVQALPGGGYGVVGYTESNSLNASVIAPQFYLLKIDAMGDTLWQRSFGGTDEDRAHGLAIAADGSWLVAGLSYDNVLDYQAQVMRVAADGQLIWTYNGLSDRYDEANAVVELADGNIAFLGKTLLNGSDFDLVVQVLDSTGAEVPGQRVLMGGSSNEGTLAKHILRNFDGSYVFAAFTRSKGKGASDMYLVRLSAAFQLTLDHTYGGSNDDFATAVVATQDGGYGVVGYSRSFNFSDLNDIVVLKTTGDGELRVVLE